MWILPNFMKQIPAAAIMSRIAETETIQGEKEGKRINVIPSGSDSIVGNGRNL